MRSLLLYLIGFFTYTILALALPIPYLPEEMHMAQRFVLVMSLALLWQLVHTLLSALEQDEAKTQNEHYASQSKDKPTTP